MIDLELYIHIPFCVRKCAYCDFLSFPAPRRVQESYRDALFHEIEQFADMQKEQPSHVQKYRVVTVFFGGGTPSLLPGGWIGDLLALLRARFSFAPGAEITVECNPGTADEQKLAAYRKAGVNRLSLGLQSADDKELAALGRIHTWADFGRTYELARQAGFSNINVDLMSALPGQTVSSWEKTLRRVLALEPEHISAYSLIIEEGTPFYEKYAADAARRDDGETPQFLPSEEEERQMYELTETLLSQAGLYRYEISNYARPGFACRHNIGYWRGVSYAGFGLGASSLLDGVRYRNPESLDAYLAGDFSGRESHALTRAEQMEECMFLGLRLMQGVEERDFAARFGQSIDEVYGPVIRRQQSLGLLERENGYVRLTSKGVDLSNAVMAEFLF